MALNTTLGQLMVNDPLPEDMRDYSGNRKLDKKGVENLFQEIADRYPERYAELGKKLSDVGRKAAFTSGGQSFGLKSLLPTQASLKIREELNGQLRAIKLNPKLDQKARDARIVELLQGAQQRMTNSVYDEGVAEGDPLTRQLTAAGRGNKFSLNSLRGSDLLYADHTGKPIPIPVMRSYGEGLRPVEYFAGAFGARKGIIDLKCLGGDTLVVMADWTTRKIREIRVGEYVMGSDCHGRLRPVRVVRVFENGVRPCKRWTFRVGACKTRFVELVATAEHKVLGQIREGRPGSTYARRSVYTPTQLPLQAARIQTRPNKNTFVAWPGRGEEDDLSGRNEPRALALGLLLGDGCTPENRQLTLSCGDPLLIEDTAEYLAGMNLWLKPPREGYSYALKEREPSKQLMTVRYGRNCYAGTGNPFKQWLGDNDCLGHLAQDKVIPADVWGWDRASVCQLLAGLIATDGCIDLRKDGCTVKLKMTSEQIVRESQRLLELRLGVWCTPVRRIPKEKIPLGNHDQFEITFSHPECVRRFASLVSLPGVKRHQLAAGLERLSRQARSEQVGFKIQSAEALGELETFDIEVDHPDHLFLLANGLVVSNSATQDAGFFAKQLTQAAHRLIVTSRDHDGEYDETTPRGLPVDVDDQDNVGALLAHPVGGYARNTEITPRILKDLRAQGVEHMLVRSPTVGGPDNGGVYGRDVGRREKAGLAPIGDYVGISAAQALAEPLTQGMISSKHTGGIAGAGESQAGFADINRAVQVPEVFTGGATHAQTDGTVSSIEDAPQGGKFVTVHGKRHYVAPDRKVKVKPGDEIEAGDILSDGHMNPAEIVAHKGIGEGRRYFTKIFRDLGNSGGYMNRRNVELLSRGLINHVRMNDEMDDWIPDDLVPYQTLESRWQPRDGAVQGDPSKMVGKFLEKPVLHYTIGTPIRPSMAKELSKYGVKQITAHDQPAPFTPEMVRGMETVSKDKDFMTRFLGSYQQKGLMDSVHTGATSDMSGTSYAAALAPGETFGQSGFTKGWDPNEFKKPTAAPEPPAPPKPAVSAPKPAPTIGKFIDF